jgi:hemolysin D
MVQNKDIGFVQPGQDAEIKIDTFDFTKYGLLHGRVVHVSHDAVTPEKPADKSDPAAKPATSSPDAGAAYAARISLDRTQMAVEDKLVSLGPGMAVTVEIKTGSRRVIEYVLSPVLRYRHDSLKER